MALSKRLRYEILRRDNHACRYCGRAAPAVALTVDHVLPVALGGADDPSNLVAACTDCNAGKTSSAPDAPLVADVSADVLRWAKAIEEATALQRAVHADEQRHIALFDDAWTAWVHGWREDEYRRPADWEATLGQMVRAGVNDDDLDYAIRVAMRSSASPDNKWRYFCGVVWKMIRQRQEAARAIVEVDSTDGGES